MGRAPSRITLHEPERAFSKEDDLESNRRRLRIVCRQA